MRENINKLWQWLRDRKTNTIRRWRSTLTNSASSTDRLPRSNGSIPNHSQSAVSLPSTARGPEYEEFFEEPEVKHVLAVRRQSSFRSQPELYPVAPPDLEEQYGSPFYGERLSPSPRNTPVPTRHRSPKQIRFTLPEVHVTFEKEEPRRLLFTDQRRSPPLPPPEVQWTSMDSTAVLECPIPPRPPHRPSLQPSQTFDEAPRRNSASERARQSLIASRRQSAAQLAQSMTGRRNSTTLIPLTCAQIHLVRSLWRQIYTTKGPTVIGTSVYHRLTFKSPVVKEQLRRVPLPPKFPNHDCFIKAHSKAIAEIIDQVVENLDDLEKMSEELVRIGRVHARVLQGELNSKLWNVVAETFIDCTLEWGDKRCRSETVRKAWALIIAFMIEKIKLGHHEQRKLMLTSRQSQSVDVSHHSQW